MNLRSPISQKLSEQLSDIESSIDSLISNVSTLRRIVIRGPSSLRYNISYENLSLLNITLVSFLNMPALNKHQIISEAKNIVTARASELLSISLEETQNEASMTKIVGSITKMLSEIKLNLGSYVSEVQTEYELQFEREKIKKNQALPNESEPVKSVFFSRPK